MNFQNAMALVGLIFAGLALIAVPVAIKTYRRQFPSRRLEYSLFALPLLRERSRSDLSVRVGGEEVIDPYRCRLHVELRGRAAVSSSEFDANKPIEFHVAERIFPGEPLRQGIEIEDLAGQGFQIPPQLIRPGGSASAEFVSDGIPTLSVFSSLVHVDANDVSEWHAGRSRRRVTWLILAPAVPSFMILLSAFILRSTGPIPEGFVQFVLPLSLLGVGSTAGFFFVEWMGWLRPTDDEELQ